MKGIDPMTAAATETTSKATTATAEQTKPEPAKNTRRKSVLTILCYDGDTAHWADIGHPTFADVRDAEKWLRKNGEEDQTYRIIAIKAEHTIKTETKTVRKLV